MNRMELLDSAPIPGNGGEMKLFRHGDDFSIRVSGNRAGGGGELMNSRMHGSEDKLAELACARIAGRVAPRVLVGGLGMGFTLAAALRYLGADAEVTVAELVPAVIAWNRGPLGACAGNPLDDARTRVHEGDVAGVLRTQRDAFDAILLDVDNGPEGLTHKANDWLYSPEGLKAAQAALRAGGVLAVWSAGPDPRFTLRLRKCGYRVEEKNVRAHGNKGARHLIWFAEKS
jgi:spermidine synthase